MATRDQLYAKFGITAEAAQLFETDLGTMLLALEGQKQQWHLWPDPDHASQFYAQMNRQTLGQLLMSVKKHVEFDDELTTKFASALRARNLLNHGFFERHNYAIQTAEGRDAMLANLEELHTELFEAWQMAQKITELLVESLKDNS